MENTGISMFRCPEPMHLELPSTTFGHGRGAAEPTERSLVLLVVFDPLLNVVFVVEV